MRATSVSGRKSQASIEAIFHSLAILLLLLAFFWLAAQKADEMSAARSAFAGYSGAVLAGDRALLDPEKGLASVRHGRPADHLLTSPPANSSGSWCVVRAADHGGKLAFPEFCSG